VLRLSELLNYVLYECNTTKVQLNKEIDFINNYISLEKIRYGEKLTVNFNIKGEVADRQIAPMLILPFIENSFKYGVSSDTEKPWINIELTIESRFFILSVENSKDLTKTKDEQGYRMGIGLTNVKNRLNLLYDKRFNLKIVDKGKSFSVMLQIEQ